MDLTKTNVMLDTETFSTRSNAVIISVGAVKFDQSGIKSEFYINIDPAEGKSLGMHISKDTLNWWQTQNEEVLKQSLKNSVSPKEAIQKFANWYGIKSLPTWANGAAFDIPILESYYTALEQQFSWKYFDVKCHRTIINFLDPEKELLPVASGDLHNALVDAKMQAEHLIRLWNRLQDE